MFLGKENNIQSSLRAQVTLKKNSHQIVWEKFQCVNFNCKSQSCRLFSDSVSSSATFCYMRPFWRLFKLSNPQTTKTLCVC